MALVASRCTSLQRVWERNATSVCGLIMQSVPTMRAYRFCALKLPGDSVMSYVPAPVPPQLPPPRHALGLPAGSVRALLALSVLGLLWLLALQPMPGQSQAVGEIKLPTVFMDLQILMVLILAHY